MASTESESCSDGSGVETCSAGEHDVDSLLQAGLETRQSERGSTMVRFLLGRGVAHDRGDRRSTIFQPKTGIAGPSHQAIGKAPAAPKVAGIGRDGKSLLVPTTNDSISRTFWQDAALVINGAGMSTPLPLAALVNSPPKPPTPQPWEAVMHDATQPLDTKLGSLIMFEATGAVTPTPPPSQDQTNMQFVAQCPMVLFNQNLSIRAPSCGLKRGRWIDPARVTPFAAQHGFDNRSVLRWEPLTAGGISFGVDSAIEGRGGAHFAEITQELTLSSYKYVMRNCVGVERWQFEEMVYRVDSMGKVSSTMEMHDINMNSEAYFYRYLVRTGAGKLVAESTLFRMGSKQINFTEYNDDVGNNGKVLAIVDKQGQWQKEGWKQCMSPTSPRGWHIYFTEEKMKSSSSATIQDLRLAMAGAITLMAHRDETRGSDGINQEGSQAQERILLGGIMLVIMAGLLTINCCQVFRGSGLKDRLKKALFDTEGAFLPRGAHSSRAAPLHPSY
jgi:hypothetical protein